MTVESFRFKVGELDCLAVSDGTYAPDAQLIFANAAEEELKQALEGHGLQGAEVPLWEACLLVRTNRHTVLVDTGMGRGRGPTTGRLLLNLEAEGIDPAEIDTVVLTHGHGDHIGGLTDGEGRLVFPHARYVMSREEWDFWMSAEGRPEMDEDMAHFLDVKLGPIAHRVELLENGGEIAPGVRVMDAAGHTPGHMMVEISAGRRKLLYTSDTLIHPLNLLYPDWYGAGEWDPQQAIVVRRGLLERAAREGLLLLAFHFPFPGLGYIRGSEEAWRWNPVLP